MRITCRAAALTVSTLTGVALLLNVTGTASAGTAGKTFPSWYEVGTKDKVIPASAQRAMAASINAHVSISPTGHLPMASRPGDVTDTIESAARARD
jgi:pimeloyl-ACP methyl ester carboxylesterase